MKLICEINENVETLVESPEGKEKNYFIKGVFLQAEQKNRNGRIYPMETMAKEVDKVVKLQVRGGAANPSPPVGPALGAAGVNIMEFCKQFNARTQDKQGKVLPVAITVYKDKSFDFVIKTPPAAVQLMEAAKVKKGSGEPNRKKVASVTWDQVKTP